MDSMFFQKLTDVVNVTKSANLTVFVELGTVMGIVFGDGEVNFLYQYSFSELKYVDLLFLPSQPFTLTM